jgi:23S rRNA (pseudouridine1915-N3)-methyltransferase
VRIFLLFSGKPRDPHANAMAAEYVKRCARFVPCEMREIQPTRYDPWVRHPSAAKVLLDPAGKKLDSQQFAKILAHHQDHSRDLVFLVGGADGHPLGWTGRADLLLSLSSMTYAHELARVMLAEQIYRAWTILRGHPYSK